MIFSKKAMVKTSIVGVLILVAATYILLLSFSKSSLAILASDTYLLGETVHFDLTQSNEYSIKIDTPTTSYVMQGSKEVFSFKPQESGKYAVKLTQGEDVSNFEFIVLAPLAKQSNPLQGANVKLFEFNDGTFFYGDTIKFDLHNQGNYRLRILSSQREEIDRISSGDQFVFTPQSSGKYFVEFTIGNGMKTYELTVLPDPSSGIVQENASINEPVKWRRVVKNETEIPLQAKEIVLYEKETMRSLPFTTQSREGKLFLISSASKSELILEYTTPSPTLTEGISLGREKYVTVSSPPNIHYENVKAYTSINEITKNPSSVKVFWQEEQSYVEANALDTDGDGLIDYVEWIAPHLSDQNFIIIVIIEAEHLDANRTFIEDIYPDVRQLDGNWSKPIPSGEYVRVKFEENLTNKNDITIFPRIVSGTPSIEIYEKDKDVKIAEFSSIDENVYNKVFLTSLVGTQDVFDLKIIGGTVEFDHIIDPISTPFFEDFETDLTNWDDNGATAWDLSTTQVHAGLQSVQASNNNEGDLISDDIGASLATWINVSFYYQLDDTEDADADLYFYNGTGYTLIDNFGAGTEDVWLFTSYYTQDTQYFTSNFRIRFNADLAGNENIWIDDVNVTMFIDDTPPPSDNVTVQLITPNQSQFLTNRSVFFEYIPTTANTLTACDLYTTEGGTWGNDTSNATTLINGTENNFTFTFSSDGLYTWNVLCADSAPSSTFAILNRSFTIDTQPPNVTLLSPADGANITGPFELEFWFNASDTFSGINYCEIYVDGVAQQSDNSITENITQIFYQYMDNGQHNWSIACADTAGNIQFSENRSVNVSIDTPAFTERLLETHETSFTGNQTAVIHLNNTDDGVQDTAEFTFLGSELITMVEATTSYIANNGAVIPSGTIVDWQSIFTVTSASIELTWKVYEVNETGSFLLCQFGDDGPNGEPVNQGTETATNTTCFPQDLYLPPNSRILLMINGYNTQGQLRSITHAWDNPDSFVDINITTEGFINVDLADPLVDPAINLGNNFNATCEVSCSRGTCRNVDVYIQRNTSTEIWQDINASGNIQLGGGQSNPISVGNISTASQNVSFTLSGASTSSDNNIRCAAIGTYDQKNGTTSTLITVADAGVTPPVVNLTFPPNATWYNVSIVSLFYNVSDVNDNLFSSTLILNGVANRTNQSQLLNGQINNFTLAFADGTYNWTVNATDTTSLGAVGNDTRWFYVDTQAPEINLSTPTNDTLFLKSTIEFNFTVTDALDTSLVCDLIIDSVVEDNDFTAISGQLTNRTIANVGVGNHLWNVTCTDEAGNLGQSFTRNFTVQDVAPTVTLVTQDNFFTNLSTVVLEYNATDNNGFTNASLYLNDVYNVSNSTEVINGAINNFTLIALAEGLYNWTVNVTDTVGLGDIATTRYFTVDYSKPTINLSQPVDSTVLTYSNVSFNFTTIDNLDNSLTCDLFVANQQDIGFGALNGTLRNRVINTIPDGLHTWNVSCVDDSGNRNDSEVRLLNISEPPSVEQTVNPNTFFNTSNFNLTFIASDNSDVASCELYIDEAFDQANSTQVIDNVEQGFNVTRADGIYSWYVLCTDTYGLQTQTGNRTFTVDTNGLTVDLLYPFNSSELFTDTVEFSYNVTDNIDPILACNITVNSVVVDTYGAGNGNITNRSVVFTEGGFKQWNVTCVDDSTNTVTSQTRNFTLAFAPFVNITSPLNGSWTETPLVQFFYFLEDDNDNLANSTLILNGRRNITNQSQLLNGQSNNFTLTLADGLYNWTVNSTDLTNLEGTDNDTWFFYVDTQVPIINLSAPPDGTLYEWNNISLNFTVTDNLDPSLTCDVLIDGVIDADNENFEVLNGSFVSRYSVQQDGNYTWSVECDDEAGNQGFSENRTIQVEAPPRVTLLDPTNEEFFNVSSITFIYLPEDPIGITNCSLFVDGTFNQSETVISNHQNNSFIVPSIAEGNHNWSVQCVDAFPDFNEFTATYLNFTVDFSAPNITLLAPQNNSNTLRTVEFNFSATDTLSDTFTCDLYIDGSANITNIAVSNGSIINNTVTNLALGNHLWNVTCIDEGNNVGWSERWLLNVTLPDLFVNGSEITFNNSVPTENETVQINTTIYNLQNVTITDITAQFYQGDPDASGVQIGSNQTITSLGPYANQTISVNWGAPIGTTEIFVLVDPPISSGGFIEEFDETNNEANTSITVGAWHVIYGDVNANSLFVLANNDSQNIRAWLSVNYETGNLYVADLESSISWTDLQAISRTTADALTLNDFSDLDTALNMTAYTDSISETFLNETGDIVYTSTFSVFQSSIDNVPVANSTNTTNFMTGILYDTSDDSNGEYDTTEEEDIVFVSKLNKDQPGAYGTYDYEIRIPARLREYVETDIRQVVFYAEIQ